jgi:uncharacterized protein (DUF433 family)
VEAALDWKDRVVVDPDVCHGQACIKGSRVLVSVVLDGLASGETEDAIVRDYRISREDVRAALLYAGELARETVVALPRGAV